MNEDILLTVIGCKKPGMLHGLMLGKTLPMAMYAFASSLIKYDRDDQRLHAFQA
ncbi:hypothetical protein LRP31_34375 (plasmid) [Mesorhizobium mediterraneum]|uniref:hypothetical protein n=1 Tax=Mesorhizobium TaxID=68287 RepID=UPI00130540DF|nr:MULTISPECIES: hypothetical protein [Mesorhizobium]WIW57184.1 hypothetical protein LRP31_34375 [Mesorhizobium mediterraneum]